jgi:hypothetical protein
VEYSHCRSQFSGLVLHESRAKAGAELVAFAQKSKNEKPGLEAPGLVLAGSPGKIERLRGVSEAGVVRRNPERSQGSPS